MKKPSLEDATKEVLKKFNIKALKKYGQNFLIDKAVLDTIIESAKISKDDCVVEIGPGLGTMTRALCEKADKVLAIEIDKQMIDVLKINMSSFSNFELIEGDVLELDIKDIVSKHFGDRPCKVVANLPYYITSPIVMKLIEKKNNISSISLMVQKEVAERIVAKPGGKDYGILSVFTQYYALAEIIDNVSRKAFIPEPNVDSAIIYLEVRKVPIVSPKDEEMFFKVIRGSFAQRRKTILNSLFGSDLDMEKKDIEKALISSDIDKKRRGETLTLKEFSLLSDQISLFQKN